MPTNVLRFEPTPNPNAVKCILDQVIIQQGHPPRSYRSADSAADDPIASALFAAGSPGDVTSVLINADWITINKAPAADWKPLQNQIKKTLSQLDPAAHAP